jgi:hypothetical protein
MCTRSAKACAALDAEKDRSSKCMGRCEGTFWIPSLGSFERREGLQKRGICTVNVRSEDGRWCWFWIFEIADTSCPKELYFGRGRGESSGRERQKIICGICGNMD